MKKKYINAHVTEEQMKYLKDKYGTAQNGVTEAIKVLIYRDKKQQEYLSAIKGKLDKALVVGEE